MVTLELFLLENYPYCSTNLNFPIVAQFSSDERVELSSKIDIRKLTLIPLNCKDDELFFGVLKMPGIGVMRAVSALKKGRGIFVAYDVFELDEELMPEYQPGEYTLTLTVDVFVKVEGKFHKQKLTAEKCVIVK